MIIAGGGLVFCFYIVFVSEPYAVEVYSDRFVLRCILRCGIYHFTDVSDVSLDTVSQGKGFLKTVRVDFQLGRILQLAFPNVRQKLYDDLYSNWRVAA